MDELVQGSWSGLVAGDRVGVATGEAIVFAAGMANVSFPLHTKSILIFGLELRLVSENI